jgi:hypothetical protein
MSLPQQSQKAFISVIEMAEMTGLSKSRFHALVRAGVFPKPVLHECCKRPVFDLESQQKCLEIRATGIGLSGQPVIFNRMRANRKPRTRRTEQQPQQPITEPRPADDHSDLLDALKGLGMTATNEAVATALAEIYPNSTEGIEPGEVIRMVFLNLRAKKK